MSAEEIDLICITCPVGCQLKVFKYENSLKIEGALCPRGIDYAKQEVLDPRRVVMTVIKVRGGDLPIVSVKTRTPIPKRCIPEIMKLTTSIEIEAPIEIGQIIIRDICGTDIVATRKVRKV